MSERRLYWTAVVPMLIVALVLSGCASPGGRNPSRTAEIAWQVMHVVDAGQTMHIASAPGCYRESNFMTKAIVGEHPSESEVAAVMVGYALLHAWVSRWLDEKNTMNERGEYDSPWFVANTAWHGLGLLTKGATIANNHMIGLRPMGSGCP